MGHRGGRYDRSVRSVVVVTPALAKANNGNWQTARRWAGMLRGDYRVRLTDVWDGGDDDLMIALHARRSAASIRAWRASGRGAGRPLVVVLTGTDLYRDIDHDDEARQSLALADRLVVLQELGPRRLPAALLGRVVVCVQSAPPWRRVDKPVRWLRALMVGHLRAEKCPQTFFEAARLLRGRSDIRLDHIGAALEPTWAVEAQRTAHDCPNYRWLQALGHGPTRRRIQHAHVLVHASRMEGGAQVVIEAVSSGTPVLASRIDGNVGLLGEGYAGYFEVDDAAGLATLIARCRDDPAMLARLRGQCGERAALFHPDHERGTLRKLVHELLTTETHR